MHRLLFACLLPLAATCAGGCLFVATGDKTIRASEPRTNIAFASDDGLLQFQGYVNRHNDRDARDAGESEVVIPFITYVQQQRIISKAAFFNDQVRAADVNGDGTLSDAEVKAFVGGEWQAAEQQPVPPAPPAPPAAPTPPAPARVRIELVPPPTTNPADAGGTYEFDVTPGQ